MDDFWKRFAPTLLGAGIGILIADLFRERTLKRKLAGLGFLVAGAYLVVKFWIGVDKMTQSPWFQIGWSLAGLCGVVLLAWWVGRKKPQQENTAVPKKDDHPPAPPSVGTVSVADMETELIIHSATWGPVDKSKPPLDVTEIVERHLHRNQDGRMWLDMEVTRLGELGDPCPGRQKEITVSYSGLKKVPEWTPSRRLQLPEGAVPENAGPTGAK
jgi:F0F1-type ATP synthase assembly protein I